MEDEPVTTRTEAASLVADAVGLLERVAAVSVINNAVAILLRCGTEFTVHVGVVYHQPEPEGED